LISPGQHGAIDMLNKLLCMASNQQEGKGRNKCHLYEAIDHLKTYNRTCSTLIQIAAAKGEIFNVFKRLSKRVVNFQ